MMGVDRGVLASLDGRLLARLDRDAASGQRRLPSWRGLTGHGSTGSAAPRVADPEPELSYDGTKWDIRP